MSITSKLADMKARADANLERVTAERDALASVAQARRDDKTAGAKFSCGDFKVQSGVLHYKRNTYPVTGGQAIVEAGAARSRTTATRVVGGTVAGMLTGGIVLAPAGLIAGAVVRKNRGRVYLTVALADGAVFTEEFDRKAEGDARQFAAKFNTAAAVTR